MAEEWIRDGQGRIIGVLRDGGNGRINAFDERGMLIGWYDPTMNTGGSTYDAQGRRMRTGNQVMRLFR